MKCIYCGSLDNKVVDSRLSDDGLSIRRRRECTGCGKRFTTYETVEYTPVMVVKKNGVRQPFDVKKIKSGVIKACEKRPVSMAEIDKLADDIQKRVMNSLDQEISSKEIGEMIMDSLKKIDEIAYVRFASVYRQFKDINTFLTEIERLMTREAGNTENAAVKFDKKEDA